MKLAIEVEEIPLETVDGAVRIRGTRVTLDTVVAAFDEGATAEEIVQQYPSLNLADVYAVISYYLRHQADVRAYLRDRDLRGDEIHKKVTDRFNPTGVRERLLARAR